MAFHSSSKLWPSQRGTFFTQNDNDSRSTLTGSPPMGMSASRLQSRLEYFNSISGRSNSKQQRSNTINYNNLDRDMTMDSKLRQAPSAWSNKQIKIALQTNTNIDNNKDFISEIPSTPPLVPPVQIVPTVRVPFKYTAAIDEINLSIINQNQLVSVIKASSDPTSSTIEERDLVKRLCEQALQKRRKSLDYYNLLNEEFNENSQTCLKHYKPDVYNAPLRDLMLQLVMEREVMLVKRTQRKLNVSGHSNLISENTDNKLIKKQKEISMTHQQLPVYCIDGITILGKSSDTGLFRNTFASISSLIKPEDDPPGFERFTAIVDMSGFKDDEILIHISGNHLRIDGCGYIQSPEAGIRQRRVTENIKLPKGVYPDRLNIGRDYEGLLFIQEPWKF